MPNEWLPTFFQLILHKFTIFFTWNLRLTTSTGIQGGLIIGFDSGKLHYELYAPETLHFLLRFILKMPVKGKVLNIFFERVGQSQYPLITTIRGLSQNKSWNLPYNHSPYSYRQGKPANSYNGQSRSFVCVCRVAMWSKSESEWFLWLR